MTEKLDSLSDAAPRNSWYVAGVLAIVAVLSQLDRQLTYVLVGPLKAQFAISDTQVGILHGFAFVLVYVLFGFPLGKLADRTNRRNLIFAGLLIWSVMTIMAAFANTFYELLATRAGVGIGEAVLAPAAYSLIGDCFDQRYRGRAMGVYYLALSAGAGASLILGGMLLRLLPPGGSTFFGWLSLQPWQELFLLAGLPGLGFTIVVLAVPEPVRRGMAKSPDRSLRAFYRIVWTKRSALFRIFLPNALMSLIGYGGLSWAPALFERQFGQAHGQSGLSIGLALIAGTTAGPLLSGWLSDRWFSAGVVNARVRVMLIAACVAVPASIWAIMPSPWLCILMIGMMIFSVAALQAAVPAALQEIVPNEMRGQAVALQFLLSQLGGAGGGPVLVGLLTDRVFHSEAMLRWSLLVMSIPASLLCVYFCRTGIDAPVKRAYQATEA